MSNLINNIKSFAKENVGLPLYLNIGSQLAGSIDFKVHLTLHDDGTVTGHGNIFQATNPVKDIKTYNMRGNFFSTLLLGAPDKVFITAEGLTFPLGGWDPKFGIGPVDPVNTRLRVALNADLKSGSGSFEYLDFKQEQPEWVSVENVPVTAKAFALPNFAE